MKIMVSPSLMSNDEVRCGPTVFCEPLLIMYYLFVLVCRFNCVCVCVDAESLLSSLFTHGPPSEQDPLEVGRSFNCFFLSNKTFKYLFLQWII